MRMFWCLLFIQWSSMGLSSCDLMQKGSVRSNISPVQVIAGEEVLRKIKEEAKMEMLHVALVHLAPFDFDIDDLLRFQFERYHPASEVNGNRSLVDRYHEWVDANNTLQPNFGETYKDFERRCVDQGKTAYPGFELPRH